MKSIKNIGVYLPTPVADDAAVRRAELLAEVTSAELQLLVPRKHVERLEVARLAFGLRVPARVVALETGSADDVRDVAVTNSLDLILKTARPLPGSGKIVGGIARDLLRHCPCPIWIVRQSARDDRSPVIAAVSNLLDDGTADDGKRVIQTAAHIAAAERRRLVVVHVWSPLHRALGQLSRVERQLYLAEHRVWLLEKLRTLVDRSTGLDADLELVEGDPSYVLPELAARLSSETIVVGHRGRRGVRALLFGNAGERLIDVTRSNVLSVRAA